MPEPHADRRADRRTEAGLRNRLIKDPQTQVVCVDPSGSILVDAEGRLAQLPFKQRRNLPATAVAYLGELDGVSWLATWQAELPKQAGHAVVTMQEAAQSLTPAEVELALPALALAAWHSECRFCGRCGAPTYPEQAGWVQACEHGHLTFPRTDPAVIMPVTTPDNERLLLAHGARWQPGRFSVLAGFVEAGESAEQAVVREVAEEAGLVVEHVEALGSQSWPFPRSLMLAYRARLAPESTTIRVDGEEVTQARFFTRAELQDAVSSGEITLPSRFSIARRLIEGWWGGELLDAPQGPWS